MIAEWFTANDLASLGLADIPGSKFGIIKKAEREGWKSRPRQAKGGGHEYHVSALPQKAQMALVEKSVGKHALSTIKAPAQMQMEVAPKSVPASVDERRDAKVFILALFKNFMTTSCLTISQVEVPFVTFYKNEAALEISQYVPKWVSNVYPSFSVQTLRRWRSVRKTENAYTALAGRYGNRKGSGLIEVAENGELKKLVIASMNSNQHYTGGHIRDICKSQFGTMVKVKDKAENVVLKPMPTVRTFERFMDDWRKNNAEIHLKITNPDAHKNKYQLALGKADAGVERLNQVWEIDASPADVLCKDGRYAIYGIIDVWSRRVMYMVTKTPRTEAALLLIRKGIMEWGVPEIIKTDNGSDFKSKRFMTSLMSLGIEQDICPPYSGDKKPFIERSFRTLQHQLMTLLPGFIGHNVQDRKAIESRKSFAQRLILTSF